MNDLSIIRTLGDILYLATAIIVLINTRTDRDK